MQKYFFFLFSFIASLAGIAQIKQIEEEITNLEIQWHNAYRLKDTNILKNILADNFITINSAGNQYGKTAVINALKSDKTEYNSIFPYDMQFFYYENIITVIGKTRETGIEKGAAFDNSYFWTDIFVKNNGTWQCVLAQTAPFPKPRVIFGESLSAADSVIVYQTNEHLNALAKDDKFSGVVLIAKNNMILYKASFGNASKEYNALNTFTTAFNLASMTKMFTGVAVAQLAKQGKLSFNDAVSKYLPQLPSNLTNDITIHQLLTHTSGLGSYWTDEFHNSNHAAYRKVEDYIKFIKNDYPKFKPGSKWAYSNTGFMLLGLIIEKVSGMSYFNYIKKNIFEKAEMINADFYEADISNKNIATAYTKDNRYINDSTKYSIPVFIGPVKGGPAGGAFASALDMFNFSQALMNNKLLSKKYTDTIISGKTAYGDVFQQKKYGYGFANQIVNNTLIIFHDGGANGISTVMDIYPRSGYTVIVLSNYDHPAAWRVMGKVRELITK